jgi:NAD(P)-dependent dehydrogenase (short-subunit alcohol dehydrogenase family)
MSKTFLVTGVSGGLGRAFAQEALAAGHRVVGTVRKPDQIGDFEELVPGRATGMLLDVTDEHAVTAVAGRIEREIGPIDVLIGNAGFGVEGTVEESSMDDLRRQFDASPWSARKSAVPSSPCRARTRRRARWPSLAPSSHRHPRARRRPVCGTAPSLSPPRPASTRSSAAARSARFSRNETGREPVRVNARGAGPNPLQRRLF